MSQMHDVGACGGVSPTCEVDDVEDVGGLGAVDRGLAQVGDRVEHGEQRLHHTDRRVLELVEQQALGGGERASLHPASLGVEHAVELLLPPLLGGLSDGHDGDGLVSADGHPRARLEQHGSHEHLQLRVEEVGLPVAGGEEAEDEGDADVLAGQVGEQGLRLLVAERVAEARQLVEVQDVVLARHAQAGQPADVGGALHGLPLAPPQLAVAEADDVGVGDVQVHAAVVRHLPAQRRGVQAGCRGARPLVVEAQAPRHVPRVLAAHALAARNGDG